MKLLRAIHSLNPAGGGPVEGIRQMTPILARRGVETTVLCQDDPGAPWLADFPATVHALGEGEGYGASRRLVRWLDEYVRTFDCACVHGVWKFHGYAVRRTARRHGVPYLLYPHGMLDPWFNRRYPLKRIKKQIYWWWMEYWNFRYAARVCFTSQEEMRLAAQSFVPYRATGTVIPYGTVSPEIDLDAAASAFRRDFDLADSERILLYLGRFHEKKGIDMLIQAWKRLQKGVNGAAAGRLILAGPRGDPAYEARLRRAAGADWSEESDQGKSIWRIRALNGPSKWGALRAARFLVLPSHQENFGMVVAEALAAGTPVLLTRQVNIWREVVEAGAGWAEEDTEDGVLSLLQRAMLVPDDESTAMRNRARACFAEHFDLDRGAERFVEVLRGCGMRHRA